MLHFVDLLLQWIKTLHLQDRTLKIRFGINNLISDKLEHSKEVNQLPILMLQIIFALMYDNESNELSRY